MGSDSQPRAASSRSGQHGQMTLQEGEVGCSVAEPSRACSRAAAKPRLVREFHRLTGMLLGISVLTPLILSPSNECPSIALARGFTWLQDH